VTVTVAPREVVDLVHRASRGHGCNADLADRLAAEIAFCEVHHGGGLAAWAGLIDAGSGRLADAARSSLRLAAAEVVARSAGAATIDFDPPLPLAVIARSLRDLERRGVRCAPATGGLTGTDLVARLDLADGGPATARTSRSDDRMQAALRGGLVVDRTLWQRVSDAADGFLVSEAILDAVLETPS